MNLLPQRFKHVLMAAAGLTALTTALAGGGGPMTSGHQATRATGMSGDLVVVAPPRGLYKYSGVVDRDPNKPGVQVYANRDYIQVVRYGVADQAISGNDYIQFVLSEGVKFKQGSFKVVAQHGQAPVGNPLVASERKATAVNGVFVPARNAARVYIDVPANNEVVSAIEFVPFSTGEICIMPASENNPRSECFDVVEAPR